MILPEFSKTEAREDFIPEPRDLSTVVMDFVKRKGQERRPSIFDDGDWEWQDDAQFLTVRHWIVDEYTDCLTVTNAKGEVILSLEDNTAMGFKFLKGTSHDLGVIFNKVKPLIEKEGGAF